MSEFNELLQNKIKYFKSEIPSTDGTVFGMIKRIEYIRENEAKIKDVLNNSYIFYLNKYPESNKKELQNVLKKYYLEFIKSFS